MGDQSFFPAEQATSSTPLEKLDRYHYISSCQEFISWIQLFVVEDFLAPSSVHGFSLTPGYICQKIYELWPIFSWDFASNYSLNQTVRTFLIENFAAIFQTTTDAPGSSLEQPPRGKLNETVWIPFFKSQLSYPTSNYEEVIADITNWQAENPDSPLFPSEDELEKALKSFKKTSKYLPSQWRNIPNQSILELLQLLDLHCATPDALKLPAMQWLQRGEFILLNVLFKCKQKVTDFKLSDIYSTYFLYRRKFVEQPGAPILGPFLASKIGKSIPMDPYFVALYVREIVS